VLSKSIKKHRGSGLPACLVIKNNFNKLKLKLNIKYIKFIKQAKNKKVLATTKN
jgi:hypothetical protein